MPVSSHELSTAPSSEHLQSKIGGMVDDIFKKKIYLRKYIFKPYLNNWGAGRILAYIPYIGLL